MKCRTTEVCPSCQHDNREGELQCSLCGNLLRHEHEKGPGPVDASPASPGPAFYEERADADDGLRNEMTEEYFSLKSSLLCMGVGALLCWLDTLDFVTHFVLRFISTLAHEIGHAATATFFGAPSFPVIRLDGHAAALHGGQMIWLAGGIQFFLVYMAFELRNKERRWVPFAVLGVIYPICAFTSLWELLFLVLGHGGELIFAGICFWRAWTGGFTSSQAERYAYASLGWYVGVSNMVFNFKLMTSAAYRSLYHSNGSFGLENDYIRVARDYLSCSLPTFAAMMLFANVVLLPLATWFFIRKSR